MSKGGEKPDAKAHKERLSKLREQTHRKVDYHLQKAFIDPQDFYHLITEFFLELLEKDYEATYDEIIEELELIEHEYLLFTKQQREQARRLLGTLNQLHYRDQKISQETARSILEEFRSLADEFTTFEEQSVQRILRKASEAIRKEDAQAARTFYDQAHELYSKLGSDEQKIHYADMQNVYEQLQTA